MKLNPPKFPLRLLRWFCHPAILEDVEGDLNELFERQVESKGSRKAKLSYLFDVVRLFRPTIIRPMEGYNQLNNYGMFKNNLKISYRVLIRERLFTTINVVSLAVSMSVCLLVIALASGVMSFDTFHEKSKNIYRVVSTEEYFEPILNSNYISKRAFSPATLYKDLEEYDAVDKVVSIRNIRKIKIEHGDVYLANSLYASKDFFGVFTFETIEGNIQTSLLAPYNLVLTERMAKKLFKGQSALGKTVKIKDEDYFITSIIKNPPANSHIQFDVLISFITNENKYKEKPFFNNWRYSRHYYNYVLMKEGHDQSEINLILKDISLRRNKELTNRSILLTSQTLRNIVPGPRYDGSLGKSFDNKFFIKILVLSLIVILMACFNYVNMTMAKSIRRTKEIGVRKVVGALKHHIFKQFIVEAVLVSCISLLFAFIIYLLIKSELFNLTGELQKIIVKDISLNLIVLFSCFALLIGVISGLIPAIVLSRLKAINLFKNKIINNKVSGFSLKNVLVILQFTISLALLTGSIIIYKQYQFALNYDLRFNTNNIINIYSSDEKKISQLETAFSQIPEVLKISKSSAIPGMNSFDFSSVKYKNPFDSALVIWHRVDINYLENLQHKFIAGTNFIEKANNENQIHAIVNEKFLDRFNIDSADKAIGEIIEVENKTMLTIIGVVEDFSYSSISLETQPVVIVNGNGSYHYLNVKVNSNDSHATMEKLEQAWKKIDGVNPFEAEYYDQQIKNVYQYYLTPLKVMGFLSGVSIIISILGLLGMTVYTTETKIKEVSIRKVMGASEVSLIGFLSKGFVSMFLLSVVIVIPSIFYYFKQYYFNGVPNHISIGFSELFTGVGVLFSLGVIIVGMQVHKAVKANPAVTLKNE